MIASPSSVEEWLIGATTPTPVMEGGAMTRPPCNGFRGKMGE